MQVHYCFGYLANKRPARMLTETEAREAHEQGKLYSVIVGDLEQPFCILEITAFRVVNVYFLDRLKRPFSDYQYIEQSPGQLFLSNGGYRTYDGDSDTIIAATGYTFEAEGCVTIEDFDYVSGKRSAKTLAADISHNWEPYPEFGDFEGLARCERQVISGGGNFRCQCCGYKTLQKEPPGTFESCPVCGWVDDLPFREPSDASITNTVTLDQARANYRKFEACSASALEVARKPLPQEL